jgi:hypothetical protein
LSKLLSFESISLFSNGVLSCIISFLHPFSKYLFLLSLFLVEVLDSFKSFLFFLFSFFSLLGLLFLDELINGSLDVLLNCNSGGFSFGFVLRSSLGIDSGKSFGFGGVGCSFDSISILFLNSVDLSLDCLSLNLLLSLLLF